MSCVASVTVLLLWLLKILMKFCSLTQDLSPQDTFAFLPLQFPNHEVKHPVRPAVLCPPSLCGLGSSLCAQWPGSWELTWLRHLVIPGWGWDLKVSWREDQIKVSWGRESTVWAGIQPSIPVCPLFSDFLVIPGLLLSFLNVPTHWEQFIRLVKLIFKQFFTKTGNKKNGYWLKPLLLIFSTLSELGMLT